MNKYVYGISARIECLDGDILVKTNPGARIFLGWRLKIGWWLMKLGMRIAAGEYDDMIEEKQKEHVCKNCKWRSDDFTSVCVNGESEHCADFVSADDLCEEWEGKDDQKTDCRVEV